MGNKVYILKEGIFGNHNITKNELDRLIRLKIEGLNNGVPPVDIQKIDRDIRALDIKKNILPKEVDRGIYRDEYSDNSWNGFSLGVPINSKELTDISGLNAEVYYLSLFLLIKTKYSNISKYDLALSKLDATVIDRVNEIEKNINDGKEYPPVVLDRNGNVTNGIETLIAHNHIRRAYILALFPSSLYLRMKQHKEGIEVTVWSEKELSSYIQDEKNWSSFKKYMEDLRYFNTSDIRYDYNTEFIVAFDKTNDEIAGISRIAKNPYAEKEYWISYISIRPEYRGVGLSGNILDVLFKHAKERGIDIQLSSYTKLGSIFLKNRVEEYATKYGVTLT